MKDKLFLYRIKDSDDRDCCAYIDSKSLEFACDHYFSSINLHGSCYCGRDFADYEDIETVLSENEYNRLIKYSESIGELGYGIKKGDDRYNKGLELSKGIQDVYDKLKGYENDKFSMIIFSIQKWNI